MVVFSLTDRESFDHIKVILDRLWQSGVLGFIPVILVGNKTDLVRTRQVPIDGEKVLMFADVNTKTESLSWTMCRQV